MTILMIEKIRAQVKRLPHPVRWAVVLVLGGLFLIAGLAMLVLPGPGIVFIGIGFAILAIEFTWAEVVLHRATTHGRRIINRLKTHANVSPQAHESTENDKPTNN